MRISATQDTRGLEEAGKGWLWRLPRSLCVFICLFILTFSSQGPLSPWGSLPWRASCFLSPAPIHTWKNSVWLPRSRSTKMSPAGRASYYRHCIFTWIQKLGQPKGTWARPGGIKPVFAPQASPRREHSSSQAHLVRREEWGATLTTGGSSGQAS